MSVLRSQCDRAVHHCCGHSRSQKHEEHQLNNFSRPLGGGPVHSSGHASYYSGNKESYPC